MGTLLCTRIRAQDSKLLAYWLNGQVYVCLRDCPAKVKELVQLKVVARCRPRQSTQGSKPAVDGTLEPGRHNHCCFALPKTSHSEENNKCWSSARRNRSFPSALAELKNIQFMIKDSRKYAATGGWGFGHFADGKPGDAAFMKSCFPCHEKIKATDLVFTRYAP